MFTLILLRNNGLVVGRVSNSGKQVKLSVITSRSEGFNTLDLKFISSLLNNDATGLQPDRRLFTAGSNISTLPAINDKVQFLEAQLIASAKQAL